MRHFPSWISAFVEYTNNTGSPEIFQQWAGIFTIAAALERKVWTTTAKGKLYPNLYAVIVGPPGVGKTLATGRSFDILTELDELHLAPTSVTKASLIDSLNSAERKIVNMKFNPPVMNFNSLTIISDELGVLIPAYENDFMNTMTAIYDCRPYRETRRSSKLDLEIKAPQINMVAATTPGYLSNLIPEGAWDQGFMSRVIMIYSGEHKLTSLFTRSTADEKMYEKLVADLKTIFSLMGDMKFSPEAAEAIEDWYRKGGPPKPEHPRLHNYNARRITHLLKLCMIASAATSDERVITVDHYQEALGWLLQAEFFMPDIFKSMSSGGDMNVIKETYYWVYQTYMTEKTPILEFRIIRYLQERVPAHSVPHILEAMEKSELLVKKFGEAGQGWVPGAKT